MTSIEPDFIVNPKTQRIVKKSETSRTYKKLLKDKVIEGTPIEPKRKPKKVYKYVIKKDDIKKDIPIEKVDTKPKIKEDAIKEDDDNYDSDVSDLIDEQEILTILSEFMIKRKKK
jgi:hypothetical protein